MTSPSAFLYRYTPEEAGRLRIFAARSIRNLDFHFTSLEWLVLTAPFAISAIQAYYGSGRAHGENWTDGVAPLFGFHHRLFRPFGSFMSKTSPVTQIPFRASHSVAILLSCIALVSGGQAQQFSTLLTDPSGHGAQAVPAAKLNFQSTDYTDGANPQSVVVADFNKDGKLDFANVNYSDGGAGSVSVFLGNGDGTFQPKVDYAVGDGPDGIAVAD